MGEKITLRDILEGMDFSVEALPPLEINNRQSLVGISLDARGNTISINHRTVSIGASIEEIREYGQERTSVTLPIEQLLPLAISLNYYVKKMELKNE